MSVYERSGYARLQQEADSFNKEQQKVLLAGPYASNDERVQSLLSRITEVTGFIFPDTTKPQNGESLGHFIQRISIHIPGLVCIKSTNPLDVSYSLLVSYNGLEILSIKSDSRNRVASGIGGNQSMIDATDARVLIFASNLDAQNFRTKEVVPFNLYMSY